MWQSVEILNDYNTLTLKQIFWKSKNFLKKLDYHFLVESTNIESASFPMLRPIEWWEQNGPITKNGVLLVTAFFWKFCFNLRTSYKELIWCTNDPNAHAPTFCVGALEFYLAVLFLSEYPLVHSYKSSQDLLDKNCC